MREPGMSSANSVGPPDSLIQSSVAWMRSMSQRRDNKNVQVFEKLEAGLWDCADVRHVGNFSNSITGNGQFTVEDRYRRDQDFVNPGLRSATRSLSATRALVGYFESGEKV